MVTDRPYRILVTGSRNWDDGPAVARVLGDAVGSGIVAGRGRVIVVHGDCPEGADRIAGMLARNAEMVALGANVCLAFLAPCAKPGCTRPLPHDSHGAADCADRAEKAGIPVRRIRP